jgi:hypothetical protein
MTDEQLEMYLPRFGDRIATVNYCRRTLRQPEKRKQSVLERLRKKLRHRSSPPDSPDESLPSTSSLNAQKSTRKIELGWKNYNEVQGKYIQMRKSKGGGTRNLSISKSATKHDILHKATELFFPEGQIMIGKTKYDLAEYDIDLWDFKEVKMLEDITVGDIYDSTKLPMLRFYVVTHPIEQHIKINEPDDNQHTEVNELVHTDLPEVDVMSDDLNDELDADVVDIVAQALGTSVLSDVQFGPFTAESFLEDTLIYDPEPDNIQPIPWYHSQNRHSESP